MQLKEILEHIRNTDDETNPSFLIALVKETDLHSGNKSNQATGKIIELTELLENHPDLLQSLRSYLVRLFSNYDALTLYTDAGILPGHGFFLKCINDSIIKYFRH